MPRKTIITLFPGDSERPVVDTRELHLIGTQETVISFPVLFEVISLGRLSVLGQRFWPGCCLDVLVIYVCFSLFLPIASRRGGPEIPTLASSYSHYPPSSQKNLPCQSLQISPRAYDLTGFCISDSPISMPTSLKLTSFGLKSYSS